MKLAKMFWMRRGNDHLWEDADSIEKAEIWKRLNEYLELIPQYRHIAEKIYPKDK